MSESEVNKVSAEDRREARRRNRVRSQVIAYSILTVFAVALILGCFLAVNSLGKPKKENSTAVVATPGPADIPEIEDEPYEPVIVETPEPTPYVPTFEEKLEELVDAQLASMTLEEKVAGLFIVNPESITGVSTAIRAGDTTKKALAAYPVGGIIYYKKNMQSESQLKEMVSASRDAIKFPAFIAVKEEGGKVSSLANAGLAEKTDSPSALADNLDAAMAYEAGTKIGTYLKDYGFNLDFAPNSDLATEGSVNADRSYGSASATVTAFASNMYLGLKDAGVSGACGHFPGMGAADGDTDKGLAYINKSRDDMYRDDIEVFRTLIESGVKIIQTSNAACESLTGEAALPCTFSSAVITDILRNELGYDGLVISDHLNQKIITEYYGSSEAAIMALKAGCDMLLEPEKFSEAYDGIIQAVNENVISEERIDMAIRRIYRIKLANQVK